MKCSTLPIIIRMSFLLKWVTPCQCSIIFQFCILHVLCSTDTSQQPVRTGVVGVLWVLLLLAARAFAAARGGAISFEFWHFARPKLNLRFVLASVFAVLSSNKMPQPAGCTVQKHAQRSISHRFFFGVFV